MSIARRFETRFDVDFDTETRNDIVSALVENFRTVWTIEYRNEFMNW